MLLKYLSKEEDEEIMFEKKIMQTSFWAEKIVSMRKELISNSLNYLIWRRCVAVVDGNLREDNFGFVCKEIERTLKCLLHF